jgi:hypothetical protein
MCKLLNVGHGHVQVQVHHDIHVSRQREMKNISEEMEPQSLDEDDKQFFKLFGESTFEGSRAAAQKKRKIAKRQDKNTQELLLFHSLRLLAHLCRRLSESSSTDELAAKKACDHWGEGKDNCMFDVLATSDLETLMMLAVTTVMLLHCVCSFSPYPRVPVRGTSQKCRMKIYAFKGRLRLERTTDGTLRREASSSAFQEESRDCKEFWVSDITVSAQDPSAKTKSSIFILLVRSQRSQTRTSS